MESVTFNFKDGVTEEEMEIALATIIKWQAVSGAARTMPDAKTPAYRRKAFADVEDGSAESVKEKLLQLDSVETASVPTQRKLIE